MEKMMMQDKADCILISKKEIQSIFKIQGEYIFECFDKNGIKKWKEETKNAFVNEGLDDIVGVYFSDDAATATHYLGLKDTGTISSADTLAANAGWAELNNYAGDRKAWTEAGALNQSITNSANPAAFTFTSGDDIYGAFLCSAETGSAGKLIAARDFSTTRTVVTDDVLNVTYTLTIAIG